MSTFDKWPLVKALLVRMAICENTIAISLITLLRDLLSFENWRGGQKGFMVGALPPAPSGYGTGREIHVSVFLKYLLRPFARRTSPVAISIHARCRVRSPKCIIRAFSNTTQTQPIQLPVPPDQYHFDVDLLHFSPCCSECKSDIYNALSGRHKYWAPKTSICRAAVAQWTKRLTRNGRTRVRIREAHI